MDTIRSFLSSFWPFGLRFEPLHSQTQWEPALMTARLLDDQELVLVKDGVQTTLSVLDNGIRVTTCQRSPGIFSPSAHVELVPYLNVLSASVSMDSTALQISYLSAAKSKLQLREVSGDVSAIHSVAIMQWVSDVLGRAYKDVTPRRRFLVLVNPHGGQGTAKKLWQEKVEPIFIAAGCAIDVQYTGPASSPTNAAAIAQAVDLSAYDALVPVSGDGIVNELINGLASRLDARVALRMPIAPIPAGSGNALSVNIMGPEKVLDVAFAALNAIKGHPIPLDVCSVSQGSTRIYSFLSQAFGLMADLDMGTEWIRWVGGIRFILGFIYGVLTGARYDVEITLKIVESDKRCIADAYNALQESRGTPAPDGGASPLPTSGGAQMPPLAFGSTDAPLPLGTVHTQLEAPLAPGWHTFRTSVQLVCAGKLPWLSRDSMILPLTADDGLIDVVLVPPRGVLASIRGMDGQEEGRFVRWPDVYYYKVEAYRCTPREKAGYISIDGESIPYKAFQVENHARLARIMSLEGRWKGLERVDLGP